ncbi:MAG: nickel-dependent lactate racemase [Anaerolineae bacterium]|nr:nickel-dependent lactate racemase [Anaerolineae bacterium]
MANPNAHTFKIPYGKTHLTVTLPAPHTADLIAPAEIGAAPDPSRLVEAALDAPAGGVSLDDFAGARSAAIAISDKTRPVPHAVLLPPLLKRLEALGVPPEATTLVIATGVHLPMLPGEFAQVVPPDILARYPVASHDADDPATLIHLGTTRRGTPAWIDARFVRADLRVVVGNIEPHQFMGFSGGVKSAAIGLAGRATINHNHAMMADPGELLGHYEDNPLRQDIEEIGRMAGVHFALNTVMDRSKQIVAVVAGEPRAVMQAGIPKARGICEVSVAAPYDVMIVSPGGHPKDINVYQAQKALGHATLVAKPGGAVILAAACPDGAGSAGYERWMFDNDVKSFDEVFERFTREGFRVGPHKAYQIARDASRVRVTLVSEMAPDFVRRLLLTPAASVQEAVDQALDGAPAGARIAVMPVANATVPVLRAVSD